MYRFFPVLCLLLLKLCQAQYHPHNSQKYFNYRDRFRANFNSIGPAPGQSLPLVRMCAGEGRNAARKDVLHGGEQTFQLGTYIGFLGTEYALFSRSGMDLSQTIEELYYALESFNRLDYFAETYNGYGKSPVLDGFFVREDTPEDFMRRHRQSLLGRCLQGEGGYVEGEGIVNCAEKVYEAQNDHCYEHTPMSQDHSIRILWGLYLAHHCLDDGITHGDAIFRDGEKELRKECKAIFNRILEKCMRDNWILKDPLGQEVANCQSKTGKIITFRNNLLNAYRELNGIDYVNNGLPVMARFVAGIGMNGWLNTRMWLESRNLSGEKRGVWRFAYKYGYEGYFINYGKWVHRWELSAEEEKILEETSTFSLNMAPCHGPFFHDEEDFASFGWACTDRTERGLKYSYLGVGHAPGNYNGLDFLILHNLYYLNNMKDLPPFKRIISKYDCQKNVTKLDEEIAAREFERLQKLSNSEERQSQLFKSVEEKFKEFKP